MLLPPPQIYEGNDDDPSCTANPKASRLSTTFSVRSGGSACLGSLGSLLLRLRAGAGRPPGGGSRQRVAAHASCRMRPPLSGSSDWSPSPLTPLTQANVTYYIVVDGYSSGTWIDSEGLFTLTITAAGAADARRR